MFLLDIGSTTFELLAPDREAFFELMNNDETANDILAIPFVDQCIRAGMILGPNQCYGYKIPPILGGKYEIGNFTTTDIEVNYSFLADIWRQTTDLPEGTKVKIGVKRPE